MESVKRLGSLNLDTLRNQWNEISKRVEFKDNQTAVHYRESDNNRYIDPCGWHLDEYKARGGAFQKDYHLINQEYKGTIIEAVMTKYNVYRARVMTRPKNTCYLWHNDDEARIHIPIYSEEGNYFAFKDGIYRLEPGFVYLVDTTKMHTFFNGSKSDRTHVVGPTDLLL